MESPGGDPNSYNAHHHQGPRVHRHHLKVPALEHDVAHQIHEIHDGVQVGAILQEPGHVLHRVEHPRKLDGREDEKEPSHGGLLQVLHEGGKKHPQRHRIAHEDEGAKEQDQERPPHGNPEPKNGHGDDQGEIQHSQEHIRKGFPEQDLGGGGGRGKQGLHGAGLLFPGDGGGGQDEGDHQEDHAKNAGHHEDRGLHLGVIEVAHHEAHRRVLGLLREGLAHDLVQDGLGIVLHGLALGDVAGVDQELKVSATLP